MPESLNGLLKEIDDNVKTAMETHRVSYETGFVPKNPIVDLPSAARTPEEKIFFEAIHRTANSLPFLIQKNGVKDAVQRLPIINPDSLEGLSWEVMHHLMLDCTMPAHAYFAEELGYGTQTKNISALVANKDIKYLPQRLAIPIWKLSEMTGIAPTMSYCLYSLWNYYRKNSSKPITMDNIELIHSFTGSLDESWFVRIHQIMEVTLAPSYPRILEAYYLSKLQKTYWYDVAPRVRNALLQTASAGRKAIDVMERMREHCNPGPYFNTVRMLYGFPDNVVYEGITGQQSGIPQNNLGETGAQTPSKHFNNRALGIDLEEDKYFPKMRKHMSTPHRELIDMMADSRIRDLAISEAKRNNWQPARQYNMAVYANLDWDLEHGSLVNEFIKSFGEGHGTGKPPLGWLRELYEKRKKCLITL